MATSPYAYGNSSIYPSDLSDTVESVDAMPLAAQPAKRAPPDPLNNLGHALLQNLPEGVGLSFMAEHFPHVVNRLALLWTDKARLNQYIDSLIVADRAIRRGFAFQALEELTEIRNAGPLPSGRGSGAR